MFLIALSGIFRYGIVSDRIPELISKMVLGIADNPYLVLSRWWRPFLSFSQTSSYSLRT